VEAFFQTAHDSKGPTKPSTTATFRDRHIRQGKIDPDSDFGTNDDVEDSQEEDDEVTLDDDTANVAIAERYGAVKHDKQEDEDLSNECLDKNSYENEGKPKHRESDRATVISMPVHLHTCFGACILCMTTLKIYRLLYTNMLSEVSFKITYTIKAEHV
jgi:hypothetical protein